MRTHPYAEKHHTLCNAEPKWLPIYMGLWGAAPALHRSGVWGNAPCPLQEQGFKGLAPWWINNLLEFQQPVPTSKWPVLEYQHCFTTTKWSPLINDRTMSHHCLITIL